MPALPPLATPLQADNDTPPKLPQGYSALLQLHSSNKGDPATTAIKKKELERFLKQGKKLEAIARHFKVSKSTTSRLVKSFGLRGLVRKGRPPLPPKPEETKPPRFKRAWLPARAYVDRFNQQYRFANITYPPYGWVNPRTLVNSPTPRNPRGGFTTVGVHFIAHASGVNFLFTTGIRFTENPRSFKDALAFAQEHVESILEDQYAKSSWFVVKVVAYSFTGGETKPEVIDLG